MSRDLGISIDQRTTYIILQLKKSEYDVIFIPKNTHTEISE